MATVVKFQLGLPSSTSTPTTPVISTTGGEAMTFQYNPAVMNSVNRGGALKQVVIGYPRRSTTKLPAATVNLQWPKMSNSDKALLEGFVNQLTTLVLIDDESTAKEVVVIPNTYTYNRRPSKPGELVSWEIAISFMVLRG